MRSIVFPIDDGQCFAERLAERIFAIWRTAAFWLDRDLLT
jgi:hypothetical protein